MGLAGEPGVEQAVCDVAVEGGGDEGDVSLDDGAPGLLVGAACALADAGGAGEAGECAAGGHEDDAGVSSAKRAACRSTHRSTHCGQDARAS